MRDRLADLCGQARKKPNVYEIVIYVNVYIRTEQEIWQESDQSEEAEKA